MPRTGRGASHPTILLCSRDNLRSVALPYHLSSSHPLLSSGGWSNTLQSKGTIEKITFRGGAERQGKIDFKDGVLEIRMPKSKEAIRKEVKIKVE